MDVDLFYSFLNNKHSNCKTYSSLLWKLICLSIRINIGLGELSSADAFGEENVQLFVRAALGLRKTEICPHGYQRRRPCPKELQIH